jgi:hypothetical protein
METPAPVDLNKLKSILGNAKKIMKAADEKFPEKKSSKRVDEGYSSSYSSPAYDERDEREPVYNTPDMSQYTSQPKDVRDYTEEDIMNSKLPPIVKEAMLKNPIPKPSMSFSKFSLDGLEDLVDKPMAKPAAKQPIRESQRPIGSDMITISKAELNEMIDNRVNSILASMFAKTITEQAIKKTVSTLINEGKLTVKKK